MNNHFNKTLKAMFMSAYNTNCNYSAYPFIKYIWSDKYNK